MLRDAARFIAFNYVALLLNTLRGIVLIKILNPFSLGLYRLIFTYSSYFRYYNLGLNALAFYRAPPRGLQEIYSYIIQRINLILASSLGFVFTGAFVLLSWSTLHNEGYITIFISLFCIIFFTQIGETCVTIAKIKNQFDVVNRYNFTLAAGSFLLMLILGTIWELQGVVIGLALATVASSIYIFTAVSVQRNTAISLTKRKITVLFRHGIITIIPGMLTVLFSTIEVWLITRAFGIEVTGYYSVVMTFVNVILLINTDGLVFLYSRKSSKVKKEPGFVLKVTLIAFTFMAVVCVAGIYGIDWGIATFFPKYIPASAIYNVCFWGIPFLVFKNLVVYYISNNKSLKISILLAFLLLGKTMALFFIQDEYLFYFGVAASNVLYGIGVLTMFLADNYKATFKLKA